MMPIVSSAPAPGRPGRARRLAALAALASALLWTSACAVETRAGSLLTYPGEKIAWQPCGQAHGRDLECSDIDVPMDQFHPRGDKKFNVPLIRMRGKNATQNLLLNPGGPGESGLGFLHTDGSQLHDVVGENWHLLSFDPRGINKSRPAAVCYPNRATRRSRFRFSDPDSISRSAERYAWTANYVQSCADIMGEHARYINTPQTAADMNSILDAVGQKDMVFWGFSYGTLLGQTYGALFPQRSRRIVIDGVTDYFDWYQSRILRGDFVDTVNVLDGFFDECVKAGDGCALASQARSKEELRQKVMAFLRQLYSHPMPVYVDVRRQGVLTYATVLNEAIYGSLFSPSTWPRLARQLAGAMAGNATEAFLAYGDYDPVDSKKGAAGAADETNDIVDLNDGLTGPDNWPQGRKGLVDYLTPWYESSPFFFQMNREYYAKQQWSIPKGHDFVPRRGVRLAHPMLVISTTYDPVCPLQSAKAARDAFDGSRLVEIRGYGHCSLALPSLCMAKHLRAYLGDDGTLPAHHTMCEADRPYFSGGGPGGRSRKRSVVAQHLADVEEEAKVHAAQVALAEVPRRRGLRRR
ncbi:hypothetical protein CDD83_1390 [Cordyceps sp. RAO-2017]|nr:hypothetical protein CDD83_1390 [Cordyceps sp. RAO-2017]